MKTNNYANLLKARGYECVKRTRYFGINEFVKKHKYNTSTILVFKDTHGKGVALQYDVYAPEIDFNWDKATSKEVKLDQEYLIGEAEKIKEAFYKLKALKAPKHVYCF